MPSEARQKKIMEKLNRAQKCSILGPQNLGSGGGPPPGSAPVQTQTARAKLAQDCQQELSDHFFPFYQSCSLNPNQK